MELERISEATMYAAAVRLGQCLRPGMVLCLRGPLGAGKTTLTRGVAVGLQVERPDRVSSPTYALAAIHDGPVPLVHVDLYRLGELHSPDPSPLAGDLTTAQGAAPRRSHAASVSAGFESLGLDDGAVFPRPDAVTAIEWPEYLPRAPEDRIEIELHYAEEGASRTLLAFACGAASHEVLAAWRQACALENFR